MNSCPNANQSLESWIDNINSICGPFSATPNGGDFDGEIRKVGGSGLNMSRVDVSGADLFRTENEIRKSGVPDFFCVFQQRGRSFVQQKGNRSTLNAGDIVLVDSTLPFRFSYPKHSQQVSLILPRRLIEKVLSISKIELGVKIDADTHIANFAHKLVMEASLHHDLSSDEGSAILNSLASLIKPSVIQGVHRFDPHEKVFRDASEFLKDNIGETGLNADLISKEIGVSARTLYRAFAARSTTLSEFIKELRLEMSAEYIRANRGKLNLTEACYRYGFCSSSYFSTAFKRRFGLTPTEYMKRCA